MLSLLFFLDKYDFLISLMQFKLWWFYLFGFFKLQNLSIKLCYGLGQLGMMCHRPAAVKLWFGVGWNEFKSKTATKLIS